MTNEARTSCLNSMKALTKQELMKGASICKLKIGEHSVLYKKTKVKFGTSTHSSEGLPDYVILMFRVLSRRHHLEAIGTLSRLLMMYLGDVGDTL